MCEQSVCGDRLLPSQWLVVAPFLVTNGIPLSFAVFLSSLLLGYNGMTSKFCLDRNGDRGHTTGWN